MDISYRLIAGAALAFVAIFVIFGAFPAAFQARAEDSPPRMEWSKAYDWGYYDYGSSVIQARDGGFVITGGTSQSYKGDRNAFLLRTDTSGRQIWQKSYGGDKFDYGYSVLEAADGGFTMVGTTESYGSGSGDVYLVHADERGNLLWEKTFGGRGYEEGRALVQTPDGGYIIAGMTESLGNGSGDIYLIKTSAKGEMVWDRAYGGPYDDLATSIEPASDGGYIIAGGYGTTDHSTTAYLLKIDAEGHWQWDQKLGAYSDSVAYSARQTADGGFIAVGYDNVHAESGKVCLFKVDRYGDVQWQQAAGNNQTQKGYNVYPTPDGGYLVVGMAGVGDKDGQSLKYESLLIKTDSTGNVKWQQTYGEDRDIFARTGTITGSGDLAVVGSIGRQGDVETWDVYLAKFTGI